MGVPPIHPKLDNFSLVLKPMVTWAPFCGFFWSVVDCCRLSKRLFDNLSKPIYTGNLKSTFIYPCKLTSKSAAGPVSF